MDVSIIIPTRNRLPLLERALSAALSQRDVALEVIVVDDASTDGTAAWIWELGAPQVHLERLRANQGVALARNHGLARATGEWLAFLDDDDFWAPDRLSRLLAMARAEQADIALSRTVVVDERGRVEAIDVVPAPPRLEQAMLATNAIGSPSGALVRRELVERVGGFDPRFSVLADWDFWLRILDGARVAICPEVLSAYVAHPGGMHARDASGAVREFAALADRHDGIREDEFLRWIGRAHRRAGRPLAGAGIYLRLAAATRRPSDLGRALLTLAGERSVAALRRTWRRPPQPPAWLEDYRVRPGSTELGPVCVNPRCHHGPGRVSAERSRLADWSDEDGRKLGVPHPPDREDSS
jgi:glycosyltransferase involved in cell wall biosynthesis